MPHYFRRSHSRIFAVLLLSVHIAAISLVLLLPLIVVAKTWAIVLLLWALIYYLRRDAWLLSSSSHVAIRIEGDDVVLIHRDGSECVAKLLRDSLVTPAVTILNVRVQGTRRPRAVVIFPDSMNQERFRELRVLLKWGMRDFRSV